MQWSNIATPRSFKAISLGIVNEEDNYAAVKIHNIIYSLHWNEMAKGKHQQEKLIKKKYMR